MPAPVLAETAWLIESRLGPDADARFLRVITSSDVDVVDLIRDDYVRCIELIETCADLGLGLVDASIVAVAELALTTVATLNERDFRVVRPDRVDALELVP
jgi:predicted nucleic acid-binding protein